MADFLYGIDVAVFSFVNRTLQNVVFDVLMPFVTDLNHNKPALVVVAILWVLLLVKGGRPGRIAALLLIPTIAVSDQLSSSLIKPFIDRARPCQELLNVHLLVGCGGGRSFPSSHAVNNFAGAWVLAYYLPKPRWAFFSIAGLVAFSRVYVGVHYPSDVVGGGIIGIAIGYAMVQAGEAVDRFVKTRRAPDEPTAENKT